jgi:hypothetical protein
MWRFGARMGIGMETSELAHEHIEQTHHHSGGQHHADRTARRIAVLIGVLAAVLAGAEMAEKAAQNAYLAQHIQASDDWAYYQAKNIRATVQTTTATIMEALPTGTDAAVKKAIDAARAEAARLRDDPVGGEGLKQITAKAHASEHLRDESFHRYHLFELMVGGLQIAIVLASVSVVTRVNALAWVAGGIGAAAGLFGLATLFGLF